MLPIHRLVEWLMGARSTPNECAECGTTTQGEEFCSFDCSAIALERHH